MPRDLVTYSRVYDFQARIAIPIKPLEGTPNLLILHLPDEKKDTERLIEEIQRAYAEERPAFIEGAML